MQVKSIAECSKGSILQYFRPSLLYHLSLRSLFCLFLSGCFTQVLLYFICVIAVVWLLVFLSHGAKGWSVRMWHFLVILTCFFKFQVNDVISSFIFPDLKIEKDITKVVVCRSHDWRCQGSQALHCLQTDYRISRICLIISLRLIRHM